MPINSEASLAAKLQSSNATNDRFGVEHHVYEHRICATNSHKLLLKSDDLGDRCRIRGLFLPYDVEFSKEAVAEILIGGFIINSIPMRLIQALNDCKRDGFIEFSFDKFFGDSIYLHLVEKLCICELRFVNMPHESEIDVLFECCWLNNKELARMKGTTFDHFYKQVIPHQIYPYKRVQFKKNVDKITVKTTDGEEYSRIIDVSSVTNQISKGDYIIAINGRDMRRARNDEIVSALSGDGEHSLLLTTHPNFIQNYLSVQSLIVCDKKENIKGITYNCICPNDLTQVSVFDYDEKMVSIYGVKVNDKVTVFSMNPGKPWDCLYPEGNFNVNKFDKEQLVVERRERTNEPLDVYFLVTNQLHYEKGMVGPRFAW